MERFKRVDERRVRQLCQGENGQGPVIYWLNRDQRVADNWALLYAQDVALRSRRPLIVVFCLQREFLEAGGSHFRFMLQGLSQLQQRLAELRIPLVVLDGLPQETIPKFVHDLAAYSLVTDFNPLRIKQLWQDAVIAKIAVPMYEVDAHNIVPCWLASPKKEYAAYTFRPKVHLLLPEFLTEFPQVALHPHVSATHLPAIDWQQLLNRYQADIPEEIHFPSAGEESGSALLHEFVAKRLAGYDALRNDPLQNGQSGLSPYFHFGQLAPQRAALAVAGASASKENRDAYLEELVVRRELSDNFCFYCHQYDTAEAFPEWAQKTLDAHRDDPREYLYDYSEFAAGSTHEPLWNSCQQMLLQTGKLHGYLRMYWAKKILEWSQSPEEAMAVAIMLNDRYSIDGRDPNGYAGIAWSIGGVHDRAWSERPIFGKIRYMNEKGCRRKFKVDAFIAAWQP